MKLNEFTSIIGTSITLVPYNEEHVPKYNSWMQRDYLREATGSEPLTLTEEYNMQKTWRVDESKCTFIILDNNELQESQEEVPAMIGDVNLYLRQEKGLIIAEVGIMIAEESMRRQGRGFEALHLMLNYGICSLMVNQYVAKIGINNQASISLFKKANFEEASISEVFQEVTYIAEVTKVWSDWIKKLSKSSFTVY